MPTLKMDYKTYFIFISVAICFTQAVKVNMQGSLSLGRDVMVSINNYIQQNLNGRRFASSDSDIKQLLVKSAYLCRDLDLCTGSLETFINDYVLFLAKAIEAVYQTARTDYLFSEDEFKVILAEIRNLLRHTTLKINEDNHWLMWIELLKRISGTYEEVAIGLTTTKLLSDDEKEEVKEELHQKYITALAIVEGRFEVKLCVEHEICVKSIECTKALDNLFSNLMNLEESKVKLFIRALADSLTDTKFSSILGETTATELQIVLTDMAYSDDVPAKTVLSSVHQSVLQRLSSVAANKYSASGRDVLLLNAVLSDMDFAYGFRKMDPFHTFFSSFFGWVRTGMKLNTAIKQVMSDITDQLSILSPEVYQKLKNEVRTFLEITVSE